MATTFYVMTETGTIIDELCVSSFTSCDSAALFNGFTNTLNPMERGVLGLVSEYALEDGCPTPAPLTDLEQIVVAKYNSHFGLEDDCEVVEDDLEVCSCCGELRELYYTVGNPVGKCVKCLNKG